MAESIFWAIIKALSSWIRSRDSVTMPPITELSRWHLSASSPSLFAFLRISSGLKLSELPPQSPIPFGKESPLASSVDADEVIKECRRGGVKYSEKVLCKGNGSRSFFIEGDDIFFLRTAAIEDAGSVCVAAMVRTRED